VSCRGEQVLLDWKAILKISQSIMILNTLGLFIHIVLTSGFHWKRSIQAIQVRLVVEHLDSQNAKNRSQMSFRPRRSSRGTVVDGLKELQKWDSIRSPTKHSAKQFDTVPAKEIQKLDVV